MWGGGVSSSSMVHQSILSKNHAARVPTVVRFLLELLGELRLLRDVRDGRHEELVREWVLIEHPHALIPLYTTHTPPFLIREDPTLEVALVLLELP